MNSTALQMIIPMIMMSSAPSWVKVIVSLLMCFESFIVEKMEDIGKHCWNMRNMSTTIEAYIIRSKNDTETHAPEAFLGLNIFINNLVTSKKCSFATLQVCEENKIMRMPYFDHYLPLYLTNNRTILLTNDILCKICEEQKTLGERDVKILYTATLYSKSNDIASLRAITQDFVSLYNKEKDRLENEDESQQVYVLDKMYSTGDPSFRSTKFVSNKTFDNVFFEEKQKLVSYLDAFMNGKDEYDSLGLPYTFGIMMYGAPGTGKTSTIKAIANYTDRSVLVVTPSLIQSRAHLEAVFSRECHKYVIVVEEIDCGAWKDVVKPRKEEEKVPVAPPPPSKEEKVLASPPPPTVALSDILEVLDGIIEAPGRILVFTTNHPENIDPALVRPGRIDHVIEFKNMTVSDVNAMYKLWFEDDIPQSVQDDMKDYAFSQAEIGNMFKKLGKVGVLNALAQNIKP